jgi:hypothetical protein
VCSFKSGACLRAISLGGAKPIKILVTPLWGFIVVCERKDEIQGRTIGLRVLTLNGEVVWRRRLQHEIVKWTACNSEDGFDFVVFSDQGGKIWTFEVGVELSLRQISVVATAVIGIHFLKEEDVVVVALDGGKLEYFPCHSNQ